MRTLRCLMALLGGVAAAASGCVSDRTTDSDTPPASDCSLPLDEGVVGATQAIVAIRGFAFEPAQVTIPVVKTALNSDGVMWMVLPNASVPLNRRFRATVVASCSSSVVEVIASSRATTSPSAAS